jgi:hypothetical protein
MAAKNVDVIIMFATTCISHLFIVWVDILSTKWKIYIWCYLRNSQLIVKMTIFNVFPYHILLYYIMEQN